MQRPSRKDRRTCDGEVCISREGVLLFGFVRFKKTKEKKEEMRGRERKEWKKRKGGKLHECR